MLLSHVLSGVVLVLSAEKNKVIYFFIAAADLCSYDELFNARFIFEDYADVVGICKSFEPFCSASNFCNAVFL